MNTNEVLLDTDLYAQAIDKANELGLSIEELITEAVNVYIQQPTQPANIPRDDDGVPRR